ncbi:PREDICTED: ATP-dependent DNA helicase Q-like SIM [Amphimedon queenslandica]|nr:PREDICTED: ATP-dependent DNA helicase Q-like SIM [Amphimedon queenslandica]|eukprot:XP_019854955.1 PREDICTED: ATP-dependent DNA helicase Q-like SIM [Amphimedon queenslandica]
MADNLQQLMDNVQEHFGVILKDKQREAMVTFMSGYDVFVVLPTGYGKSIIYGFLPYAFDLYKGQEGSIVICVSPLVSLMMDQKARFTPKGVVAEFVGEEQTDQNCIRSVISGSAQLVYISPESLICNQIYRNMILSPIYKEKLVAFVIDEAHCVKSWGDKFRLAYSQLGDIRSLLPTNTNVMALTATATHETYKVVCQRLSLLNQKLIGCQPNRSNIKYEVRPLEDVETFCGNIAGELKIQGLEYPRTVIFVQRYSDCSLLFHTLRRKLGSNLTFPPDYPMLPQFTVIDMYTRASTISKKEQVLSAFCTPNGVLRVVIATTAFGMGVDCSDIHHIIHWGSTSTIEQYVQETGRAGRDGHLSRAILYYGKPGRFVHQEMKDYGNNHKECRRRMLIQNFMFCDSSMFVEDKDHCCDICSLNL